MKTSISSKSDSLQVIYDNYRKGLFIVNRHYQRKLVWTREEKMAFIDSIYNKYSVPLILLANIQREGEFQQYEIIDGLQRLNAICSFVENEFGIIYNGNESYFDLQTLASTKELLDSDKIQQCTPVLPRDICMEMMSSYQVPISYVTADPTNVEEIFRRINSFGRQLSRQEIRQAGALGIFPDLVRHLSSEIRGDVSNSEQIELSNMQKISLSNRRLKYGITLQDVFWVKQSIIPEANMRKSRDEEMIAYLLAYMVLGNKHCTTAQALDRLYQDGVVRTQDGIDVVIDLYIEKYGKEKLCKHFIQTFEEVRKTLEISGNGFRHLLYKDAEGSHVFRAFQVVYLAFYELLIHQSQKIKDYHALVQQLFELGDKLYGEIGKENWNATDRETLINATIGVMRNSFERRISEDVAQDDWRFQFENLLRKSTIEGSQYDFKMGLHDLIEGHDSSIQKPIHKFVKILTAEVNKAPHTKGYVIIGVTEGITSLKRYRSFYSVKDAPTDPYPGTEFYITGLNEEINKYYKNNSDAFLRAVCDEIKKAPIITDVKSYILTHLKLITYVGKQILILELCSSDQAVQYDKDYYERNGNDTNKADNGEKIMALLRRFMQITIVKNRQPKIMVVLMNIIIL